MSKINATLVTLLIILILLLGLISIGWYQDNKAKSQIISDNNNVMVALADKLEKSENKLGQETASKKAITVAHAEALARIEGLEGAQKELQDLVAETKAAVAVVAHTITEVAATVPTTITKYDTIVTDSGTVIYPTYTGELKDQWASIESISTKDSTTYNIEIIDNFEVTFLRKGFRGDMHVSITNNNPYTKTKALEGFLQKVPQKRISVGPFLGISINDKLKIHPTVGVGVMYDLFSF